MNNGILVRIRQAVQERRVRFTDHALEEADDDNLTREDIFYILQTGWIDSVYTHDQRGIRYVVRGKLDRIVVDVVCKFEQTGILLIIITVYVVD